MELHPVIMAAGRGSHLIDLTYNSSRAVLPIGNIPSLCYIISYLEKAGFEEAIVIVAEEHFIDIQKAVELFTSYKIRLDFVPISDTSWGTADSLRYVKDKIKADILVLSCDLVTDFQLYRLIDLYRSHDATLTMLLSAVSQNFYNAPRPGVKTKHKLERDIVGLDEKGNRILFFASESDCDDTFSLKKSLLRKHSFIKMKSNLTDCHMYVIKKWVLKFLNDNKSISSIKDELIPYLVKKQFTRPQADETMNTKSSMLDVNIKPDIYSYEPVDELTNMSRMASTWNDHDGDMDECYHGDKIRCYAYIIEDNSVLCVRANHLASYCEVNRQIPRYLPNLFSSTAITRVPPTIKNTSQIGNDCLVDSNVTVGDKVSIKRCIIGKHCVIGDRVKLANCVIMDHVNIAEGCSITGSIIGSESQIGDRNEIKESVIGSKMSTSSLSKLTNETLTITEQLMEI